MSILAEDITWKHIIGVGLLGGIGFTMSIFITLLAFKDGETVVESKIAVICFRRAYRIYLFKNKHKKGKN